MGVIELSQALIELVQKNPAVWDEKNTHYHDKEERQKVWLAILNELSLRQDCTFNNGKI